MLTLFFLEPEQKKRKTHKIVAAGSVKDLLMKLFGPWEIKFGMVSAIFDHVLCFASKLFFIKENRK